MGLEFQARGFVRVARGDVLSRSLGEGWVVDWKVTGMRASFYHFCQEAKWSSYDAVRVAAKSAGTLGGSLGFFSLTGDYLDLGDRDRAYVLLKGALREVDTREATHREKVQAGLYDHFAWCRECWWRQDGEVTFPEGAQRIEAGSLSGWCGVAGWFFIDREHAEFPALASLFPDGAAAIGQSPTWPDHYLFVGEESVEASRVLDAMLEASRRFPGGSGLLFPIAGTVLRQVAIAEGQCAELAPLELEKLAYHADVKFSTGDFGYNNR
jgi:hypothetical protein